jgi:hypothetical protein
MSRLFTLCCRRGCGLQGSYVNESTGQVLCASHAADICAIAVVRQFDPHTHVAKHIKHGTTAGYKKELELGITTCADCRLALKKSKIRSAAAA